MVSVIIPTYNAEQWLPRQLEQFLSQSVEAEILVVDSGSTDATLSIARNCARVRLLQVPHEDFDHGGARDYALRESSGDPVLFFTQDAVPTGPRCIEALLSALRDERVAAVYGRQIAWPDAPEYERLIRAFNYPPFGRVWTEADIRRYGVKAYFFSNCCAAYRRDVYLQLGGFDRPVATNEDMLMAAKLLHAGYALSYCPEASVYHSHSCTLKEEYRRNAAIGQVMEAYKARLTGSASEREGLHLVRTVSLQLLGEGKLRALLSFYVHSAARFAGYRAGRAAGRKIAP